MLIDIKLLEQGAEDRAGVECGFRCRARFFFAFSSLHYRRQILPEELSPIHNPSRAHMEEIHGQAAVLEVVTEDIRIVALLGGCDPLLLLELVHGRELIAQARRRLKLLGLGRGQHPRRQRPLQFRVPSLQEELCVAYRLAVCFRRGESLYARPQAAVNVVLQAGPRMVA